MKIQCRLSTCRTFLLCTIHNDKAHGGILILQWRDSDRIKTTDYGYLEPNQKRTVQVRTTLLGVTHHFVLTLPSRTYTRYIPSRHLDLGSEHS